MGMEHTTGAFQKVHEFSKIMGTSNESDSSSFLGKSKIADTSMDGGSECLISLKLISSLVDGVNLFINGGKLALNFPLNPCNQKFLNTCRFISPFPQGPACKEI